MVVKGVEKRLDERLFLITPMIANHSEVSINVP
jgi:hypothetical protein